MTSPEPAARPAPSNPVRRVGIAVLIGALLFLVLWITAFTLVTSLLIGSGCCLVIVAASSVSEIADMMLDAIASAIFGMLALIGAIFAAIFGLFGF